MSKPNYSTSSQSRSAKWSAKIWASANCSSNCSSTWKWTSSKKSFRTSTTNAISSWNCTIPFTRLSDNWSGKIDCSRCTFRSGSCSCLRMWLTAMRPVIWGWLRNCLRRMTSLWLILCPKSCSTTWLITCCKKCTIRRCSNKKNIFKFLDYSASLAPASTLPTKSPSTIHSLNPSNSKKALCCYSNWSCQETIKF